MAEDVTIPSLDELGIGSTPMTAATPGRRLDGWRRGVAALSAGLRRQRWTLLGIALAVTVALAMESSGFVDDFSNTLQVMGFDPDRAALLTSLLTGVVGAGTVAVVGGRFAIAVIVGALLGLLAFEPVFAAETRDALNASGPDGVFDLPGWSVTALTLVVATLIAAWAATVLARDVRARIGSVGSAVSDLRARRAYGRRDAGLIGASLTTLALLIVTVPVFGDMLNFEPDTHMRVGAPAAVGLVGSATGSTGASVAVGASGSAGPGSGSMGSGTLGSTGRTRPIPTSEPLTPPSDLVAGPVAGSDVTIGSLSTSRPWAGHPPTGAGRTFSVNVPAPWVGGIRNYATLDVYLPPGYDAGRTRYPVIYEPHQPLWAWDQGIHLPTLLDTLIGDGTIPPEIVVFVGQYGGPYADSECADSWDGKEWFDRYLGNDVPTWVDSHLRTIATVAARSLLGFSSGGYCAAAALTHHPDVFGSALIFSGYFEAGITTTTTPNAGRPYDDNPALEATASPIDIIRHLNAARRASMFFAFSADPANRFYGDQVTQFAAVLDAGGVPMAILPTPLGHSWAAVREQLPSILSILAGRQARLGVFVAP